MQRTKREESEREKSSSSWRAKTKRARERREQREQREGQSDADWAGRASECSTENKLAAPQQRNDEKMAEQSYKRSALSLRV